MNRGRDIAPESFDMVAARSPSHLDRPRILGSIRNAESRDAALLARLFASAKLDARAIDDALPAWLDGGHLLVLDLGGELCGAMYVAIEKPPAWPRAHLRWLVIDPALGRAARREIEDRMVGVALALCEAYGFIDVDIVALDRA